MWELGNKYFQATFIDICIWKPFVFFLKSQIQQLDRNGGSLPYQFYLISKESLVPYHQKYSTTSGATFL